MFNINSSARRSYKSLTAHVPPKFERGEALANYKTLRNQYIGKTVSI